MADPTIVASRCWRLQAFTDYQQEPRIEFLRESIRDFGGGDIIHKALPSVQRKLADIATALIAGGPVTCTTMGDVFALVAACGHQLAADDDARAAAEAEVKAAAEEAANKTEG